MKSLKTSTLKKKRKRDLSCPYRHIERYEISKNFNNLERSNKMTVKNGLICLELRHGAHPQIGCTGIPLQLTNRDSFDENIISNSQ